MKKSKNLFRKIATIMSIVVLVMCVDVYASMPAAELSAVSISEVGATAEPTIEPTVNPTADVTAEPTTGVTVEPTEGATTEPTIIPTDEPTPTPKVVKKVILNKEEITLKVGKTKKLKVSFKPAKGLTPEQQKVTWESTDKKVAKVDKKGVVKARGKGVCKIIVKTSNGKKDKCKVRVNPKKLFSAKLGSYSTTFSTSTVNNQNRRWNMDKACKTINKMIVKPGERFSFNEEVGPRTKKTGYKPAGAYRDGQNTTEYGGGICQCSTTMYNAVLRADLKVIYRRNHSFTVPYVPVGVDATVSYGEVDFIWKNNTKWPIKIKAKVVGNRITVTLLGTRPKGEKKKVKISTKILKTVPRPVEYVYADHYSKSGTVIQSGHTGYTAQSFRTITVNGKVTVKDQLIATSYYKTMPMIIGKKPAKGGNKK